MKLTGFDITENEMLSYGLNKTTLQFRNSLTVCPIVKDLFEMY